MTILSRILDKIDHVAEAGRPHALVYRGPAASDGCPEAVGQLLETSPSRVRVTYVGPHEDSDITEDLLRTADVYAQPGGGGLDPAWRKMKHYNSLIRDYVSNGGKYLGFCLGAYLAGTPGFQLLPRGGDTDQECTQSGAQVKNTGNTVIQVNWHFQTGLRAGQVAHNKWLYFQDGAVIDLDDVEGSPTVLARYSSNGDIAASLTPFGSGWVCVIGPHPEADESWYKLTAATVPDRPYRIHNPDGINFEYGHDMIEALMSRSS